MRNAFISLLTVSFALVHAGCGLISADFDGTIKIQASVVGDDGQMTFESLELVDPNDNEDYRNNKDKIKEGEVYAIDMKVIRVPARNNANVVVGQIDVRPQGAANWMTAVGEWDGVSIQQDNTFRLMIDPEQQAELNRILFEGTPIEMNIIGIADAEPVELDFEITVHIRFTAGL